jgi:hypothetical protein
VLFDIDLLIVLLIGIKESLLIEFLGLDGVALVLNLTGQLPAYVLFLIRGDLFAQFEGSKPILKVHSHLQGELRLRALQEVVLGDIVLEQDRGYVTH